MDKFKVITDARELLELPETASMAEIKTHYRRLLDKWHPDKCAGSKTKCTEMTQQLIAAYNILVNYCEQYKYSFTEEAVNMHLTPEEWWDKRFGDDPLWGKKT